MISNKNIYDQIIGGIRTLQEYEDTALMEIDARLHKIENDNNIIKEHLKNMLEELENNNAERYYK